MIKPLIISTILLLVFIVAAQAQSASDAPKVFAILEGTWQLEGRETYEKWESTAAGFFGKGYKIKDGSEKVSETLEIRAIDGALFYLATVPDQNNGATVRFKLTEIGGDRAVFENPEHDFPKKLIYERNGDGGLTAQVLGAGGKGFTLRFKRVAIPKA